MTNVKFKISSALKTIIGGELITDDFIAIFELVKNSFDAHAENVEVKFENLRDPRKASIIIKDDGKGMTENDLVEKWLHVAYSGKRDLSEDAGIRNLSDYREKIKHKSTYAGAKGIGRFSCDRLGRHLLVYTRRNPRHRQFDWLRVDWRKFEKNVQKRFEEIEVAQGVASKPRDFSLKRGTVLRISDLRSTWDREKLLKLKQELQRLINPDENSERQFKIEIVVPDEKAKDGKEKDPQKIVNGQIHNFLFEHLKIKTTEIECQVDEFGKTITTVLRDRGTLIYRIVERNTKYQELSGIKVKLFYLNRSSKYAFSRSMGIQPVQFGSVFLYKNGFRVQPYGTEGDDGFGLDRQKQQGLSHYLGTRDLLGRLEIVADNTRFKEVSSRDGGLQSSPEVDELMEFFWRVPLKRLQTYVIDVIKWGQPPKGSYDDNETTQPHEVRSEILELVKSLTQAEEVVEFETDPNLLQIVTERQAEGAGGLLSNLERIAEEKNDPKLAKQARRLKKEVKSALEARSVAHQAMQQERGLRLLQEKQLETERKRNTFLTSLVSPEVEQRELLQHWIKVVSDRVKGTAETALGEVRRSMPENLKLLAYLADIIRDSAQLISVSEMVEHGGFGIKKTKITDDLARCTFEYLDKMTQSSGPIRHSIAYDSEKKTRFRFQPAELPIIFDNIISNAKKAGAHKMEWSIDVDASKIEIGVANDGRPMKESIRDSLFELGATASGGTGIGLYTCRQIIRDLGGDMNFVGNDKRMGGARFRMIFPL